MPAWMLVDPPRPSPGREAEPGGAMDSTMLRAAQQPLKDAYPDDPGTAAVPPRAQGARGGGLAPGPPAAMGCGAVQETCSCRLLLHAPESSCGPSPHRCRYQS